MNHEGKKNSGQGKSSQMPPAAAIILLAAIIVGSIFYFSKKDEVRETYRLPEKAPEFAGVVDEWNISGSKIKAIIRDPQDRFHEVEVELTPETVFLASRHETNDEGIPERILEKGILEDVRDGALIQIYLREIHEESPRYIIDVITYRYE